MSQVPARSNRQTARLRQARIALAVTLLAPLTIFVAIAGLKSGLWGIAVAYDLLTLKVALGLAAVGAVAAILAVVAGLSSPRRAGLMALCAVVVSAATVAGFALFLLGGPDAVGGDVSTDPDEPPGFSASLLADRASAGADAVPTHAAPRGCDVTSLDTQVAPGVAGYGLEHAGFTLRGFGVGRADGSHTTFWFDRTHDAVVRIRPGRTDVRVTARDLARDNGVACTLAKTIVDGMTG